MPLIKIGNKSQIFKGKFIKLWGTEFFDRNGNPQLWEWIEKAQAVLVFPVTRHREVVLIKNFRVPLEKYVIEIPAGLRDKPGETPLEVAQRELLEESGYTGSNFVEVPVWPYRAGSSNGIIQAFIATDVTKVKDFVTGDVMEDITVMEVPLDSLLDLYFDLPEDTLFQPEILALYQMAQHLGLIKEAK